MSPVWTRSRVLRVAEGAVIVAGVLDIVATCLYQGTSVSPQEISPWVRDVGTILGFVVLKAIWATLVIAGMEILARTRDFAFAAYLLGAFVTVVWFIGAGTNRIGCCEVQASCKCKPLVSDPA